ncbi:heterokaryon incompatibility protein-domain-containing protein, partial [Echria macrotheca]
MSEKSHECSRRRGAEGSDGCSCGNASTQPWPSSVKYLSLTECTPSIAAALTHLASGPAKLHQGASDGQALPSSAFKTEPRFTNTLYGRLDARGAAIRLLRITPGGPTDPLHGSLEVANLDQPPAYDALSYTWADDQGDKSLKETIFLGQQYTPLPITSNCSAALRNLRRRETQVVLWVDSVCINQYADDERSHQVGLMGRIYSLARSVIIYLGEDSYRGKSTGEKVMDRIDYIWHGQLSLTGSYWGQDNLDTDFVDFFSRAYFSRLWIIQEIALAREAWVVCGSWRLNWTLFGSHNLKGLEVRNYIPSWIHHVLGGPRDRDLKQFAELLIATSGCQASDARDKVFGLLGLSREATELALVPDYSRSLREVYMGTAALLLQQGVADLVFTAAAASDRSLEKGIPGWVPLWNNPMTVSQQDLIQHLIPLLHWLYSR